MSLVQVPNALKQHSQRLVEVLCQRVEQAGGCLSFDAYMQCALYTPQLGYYAGGLSKFGETGDFITAPEMGDLFGRCLASQAQEVLANLSGGSMLEFGAGSGALAATILNELAAQSALPEQYFILEVSADLRARQAETLAQRAPEHAGRVQWLEIFPEQFEGVVIANEVLDAMPVKVFEQNAQGEVFEMGVTTENTGFAWKRLPANDALKQAVKALEIDTQDVYRSEINLVAQAWVKSVAQSMTRGAVFLIDYGFRQSEYYHTDRREGTLMCHIQHQAHDDPFYLPGLQDITAHVDFTAMALAAKESGFEVTGYATQGAFLLALGLLDKIDLNATMQAQIESAQQVKKLTMPHEMGELFKVLALMKNSNQNLTGFNQQNHVQRLWA
ncbi:MAG: SAM-dependent methyltransferase [Arenicellales bacterium]